MTIDNMTVSRATDSAAAAGGSCVLTPEGILGLGLGFWGSKTLLSAVELGVFSELADGPLGGEQLAARLGLHARAWPDFLDALVALGMLTREHGAYANTPETAAFLDPAKPSYIGGMLEMANTRLYPFWGSLTDALRTGAPQNEAKHGEDFFAELYRDRDRLKQFLHAMTGLSMSAHQAIAHQFPWERYDTFLDVGCAEGGLPVTLALAHQHLTGTGFDLAPCRPHFNQYIRTFELQQRLRFHPGDFFTDPLPPADVITLGHILHDWNPTQKQTLLAKAHHALPDGGALIIFDAIIDNDRRHNTFGLLMSLNMLIETPGGSDYTSAQCQNWMRTTGFRHTHAEHLTGPDSMIIATK